MQDKSVEINNEDKLLKAIEEVADEFFWST